MKKKITSITDRYDMTFVIFYRDNDTEGKIYYAPTENSKIRLVNIVKSLYEQEKLKAFKAVNVPMVYTYKVLQNENSLS